VNANTDQPQEIEISAVIIRADGTQIDLGVIDAHYENPLKQLAWTHLGKRLADYRINKANKGVR
jgi:hypothetical protein